MEAVDDYRLFHGTDADSAVQIIYQDKLLGSTSHSPSINQKHRAFRPTDKDQFGSVSGISLTRDAHFADQWKSGEGVTLAFDGKKLRTRYRIAQIDYYGSRREAEEFVVGKNIHPVSAYLVAIYVSPETDHWLRDQDEQYDYHVLFDNPKYRVK